MNSSNLNLNNKYLDRPLPNNSYNLNNRMIRALLN